MNIHFTIHAKRNWLSHGSASGRTCRLPIPPAILARVCFINTFQAGRRGPQGLKPAFFLAPNGTAEAVPYPKPIFETLFTETEITDVVGPICETGDFFARDRKLPLVNEGDLLAILDVGAYGAVLASNYNTRGRAAEVLVEGARAKVIRRRESVEDQMRAEI